MKFLFQFSIVIFCSFTLQSQSSIFKNLPSWEANADYFSTPRESLYLHLNKTVYINGEEIWFKGYTYDRKESLPSNGSTNINIQLYDKEGKELYKGLFLGNKGSFRGNIPIDSTWTSGDYYLKASTNWMNNFKEDESYNKRIKIIKESIPEEVKTAKLQYDFQLFPEGGHLISETDNSIGFKLTNDRGYGVPFDKGYILDEDDNTIIKFNHNQFGMGKFNIRPKLGRKYKAVVKFKNGEEVVKLFPKIENRGVAININNLLDDKIAIELNTNANTLEALKEKKHYLLIRQNQASKKLPISFLSTDIKKEISIKRSVLFPGVNILTLFQENTPILERLVMNSFDKEISDVEVHKGFDTKDSIAIRVRTPKKEGVTYDVSISILPEKTKSYNPLDNIYSAMVLKPHVKGFIENEKYYFTNIDRRKEYDLDLLLITQGWSKYSWNMIFNNKPKTLFDFNQGFKLKGKIQGKKKEKISKIYMHSSTYQAGHFIDVDDSYSFEIPNFFPERGENISFSGVGSDDKLLKPVLYTQVLLNQQKTPLYKEILRQQNLIENKEILKNVQIPKDFITDKVQVLGEVLLNTDKEKEKRTSTVRILRYFEQNSTKVTQRMADDFPTILDYLKSTGKFWIRNIAPFSSDVRIYDRTPNSILNPRLIPILVDDVELRFDHSLLTILRTSEIDRVYIDRISYGLGARGGAGGSIRIYTRKIPLSGKGFKTNVVELEMKKGYEPVKEFYNPGYTNYLNPEFIDYGVIHWQSWVDFNENGSGTFKIKNTGLDNVKLFIEGMGSDGSLISKVQTVKLN